MTTIERPRRGQAPAVDCHRRVPDARVRLVTFAHAGGGSAQFRHWAPGLAPAVELWQVTLPGRGARWREPFAHAWSPLVDDIAADVRRHVPAPVALLGHSLGALLAFEVARRLTRADAAPEHLVVSGRAAPDAGSPLTLPDDDDALLAHVEAVYGGVPPQLRSAPDVLAHFVAILRADLELARSYALAPDVALSCPITALTGDADPIAPPASLAGWRRQTGGGTTLRVLPGGHFSLIDAANEAAVLALVLERLAG